MLLHSLKFLTDTLLDRCLNRLLVLHKPLHRHYEVGIEGGRGGEWWMCPLGLNTQFPIARCPYLVPCKIPERKPPGIIISRSGRAGLGSSVPAMAMAVRPPNPRILSSASTKLSP